MNKVLYSIKSKLHDEDFSVFKVSKIERGRKILGKIDKHFSFREDETARKRLKLKFRDFFFLLFSSLEIRVKFAGNDEEEKQTFPAQLWWENEEIFLLLFLFHSFSSRSLTSFLFPSHPRLNDSKVKEISIASPTHTENDNFFFCVWKVENTFSFSSSNSPSVVTPSSLCHRV